MAKKSAGILLYRLKANEPEIFLVHPGGPFWRNKDEGAWSIPKGEFEDNEDALTAAKREFWEETGQNIDGDFIELHPIKQKSGKLVYAWALNRDIDAASIKSNIFSIEWPPRSGRMADFPEVDKAEWFEIEIALKKINPAQIGLVEQLVGLLST
ncbi:putative NUDIX family NTP pyrophosphohydrolase [Mucilaginibacter yixingensis]|uniref:Putative NUDIX family NTP pyrophosphohydrolase n=1 Tax=Mucilaginibacter yixingensis TaxID=1295612 RepID=A0A2T5J9Y3_9SPHI|nr:NUDIX domain-containing protein [Mucilaginibacter yixingensis]PTQ96876.1 putative NUDIX family NTP pyrophosphohydrolase [Mucilaginibacter yixingensis]